MLANHILSILQFMISQENINFLFVLHNTNTKKSYLYTKLNLNFDASKE